MESPFIVYILHCANGSYYTGYTTDLNRRYQEHVTGTGKCKYTKSFKPIGIAQSWQVLDTKSAAMKIECYIKSLSKVQKAQLIMEPQRLTTCFAACQPNL
ncbi:MAG: GIY-YIG nuclease family protein [Gammaproteobacteria bacterium]|nr:GIY-YIG nuclease family protein [Gammaproteobacteria bacterium]